MTLLENRILPAWNELLPAEKIKKLNATEFLVRCRAGTATRKELEHYLVQQHHYSKHFTRYLCALLANIMDAEDRRELTENLFDEMGLGDSGQIAHAKIYADMLEALGLHPAENPATEETKGLSATMLRLCSSSNHILGLGALCLGAEAIVPHLYSQILHGLRSAGFAEEHLSFFPLHIEGDDEHALTMKKIIDRELKAEPKKADDLRRAAEECLEQRIRFFDSLINESGRFKSKLPEELSYAV